MDKIKIMEDAVRKWDRIIAGETANGGVYDCPPCRLFYPLICFGCPIAEYTGKFFCKGSPYPKWYWHHRIVHDKIRRKVYCEECLNLAGEMRDYMMEIVEYLKEKKRARAEEENEA